jgi:glycosyltransferase involved in cell wall biosynthesis
MSMPEIPAGWGVERRRQTTIAVIWIDWYPYHVARFNGIRSAAGDSGNVLGIELVGGVGVHAGLRFREPLPPGLPILTLMPDSDWRSAGQWRLAVKLWKTLNGTHPLTLLVPGYYTLPAIAAALWARLHHCQSVLMTESTAADHARSWWKEKAKSLLIRALFDWAIAGGTAHRRYLEELGFPMDRVMRFYDVVDNSYFRERSIELCQRPASEFGLPSGYFLYIGRLSEEKNVAGLIDEWSVYREGGGTWPLVIVGNGPAFSDLQERASRSRFASDVHFAGHKGVRELAAYYAFGICFVLPSTREPWGLVVNEAMAAGLPVVVSNRCGCAEDLVQPGINGFVFDPARAGDLTQCLQRIEAAGHGQLAQMGAASQEIIERFSPEAFGDQVAQIASAALDNPQQSYA